MMTSLASRFQNSVLLIKEAFGRGVILCQSRTLFVPAVSQGRTTRPVNQTEFTSHHDQIEPMILWPISNPIYGEGWRAYSRLVVPTFDMTATWATNVSKKAVLETAIFSRNLLLFISKLDSNTAYLLLVKKSKESTDYLLTELVKSREQLIDSTLALSARTKDAVASGKSKEMLIEQIALIRNKSKDLKSFLRQKIKENDDLIQKVTSLSNKTKDYTLSLLNDAKNKKIPDEFYERSNQFVKSSKENSAVVYQRSKDLSKVFIERSKIVGEMMLHRLAYTYSQTPSMVIMLRNSKYGGNIQDMLKRFGPKTSGEEYTYVNRFYSRDPKQSVTNIVRSNSSKNEFQTMPPKQDFHSSALGITEPIKPFLNDYQHRLVFERQRNLASNVQMSSEISALIPEPVKKIWRGLRDKSLPSWQATIASILQKIQDTVMKKKK